MLAGVPGTAQEIADWAAEAGFTADREALREVLASGRTRSWRTSSSS
ncbi:hypothetical protein ACIF70_33225 [Actinacidiphila glaucinigra]|nr:hypothetical protein [Actinacidiphila glaucinigra]WSD60866.1 hypothetical protein OIE69_19050 [Actinacidiphila glaucinigra]